MRRRGLDCGLSVNHAVVSLGPPVLPWDVVPGDGVRARYGQATTPPPPHAGQAGAGGVRGRGIIPDVTSQRILVIEDDLDIANVLRMDLTDAGFEVEHADSAMNGLIKAREEQPTLILLDLGLPDFDGGDVVQRLRKNSAVPIIVLTARDTVEEKVRLLGLGADDYLIKPFHPDELLARVKVQLRQRTTESLTMGELTLDPQKRLVTYKGDELRLSPKEFDILALLIRQPGRVYSRQEIGQEIWQGRLPEGSNVVDVHMANLRAKLRDLDGYGLLRTVRGVGYALRG